MKNMLKKISVAAIAISFTIACKSKQPIEAVATSSKPTVTLRSETPNLPHAESVVYDPKSNLLYVSVQGEQEPGDGSIATLKLDGSLKNIAFAKGLNNPKGIAIIGNRLYVSDVTELVQIDLENGNILNKFSAGDEQFLNDVAIDKSGNVYVSDMGSSSIYKLGLDGNFEKWLSSPDLENPNGLLVVGNTLYVAAWGLPDANDTQAITQGRFLKVDLKTKNIEKVTSQPQGNLDGLQVYDNQHFLISDWRKGNIYKASKSGEMELFFASQVSVGDILYIQDQKILALPLNRQNTVQIFEVTN